MKKLSLNALKERAEAVASTDLLNSISGGIDQACHSEGGISETVGKLLFDYYNR